MFRVLLNKARRMKMKVIKPLGRNRNLELVKLSLCDQNPEIAQTLANHFQEVNLVLAPSSVSRTISMCLLISDFIVSMLWSIKIMLVRINSVAVPGLRTGVGGMAADEAALQIRAAYDMAVPGGWRQIVHPVQAPFALGLGFTPLSRRQRENP